MLAYLAAAVLSHCRRQPAPSLLPCHNSERSPTRPELLQSVQGRFRTAEQCRRAGSEGCVRSILSGHGGSRLKRTDLMVRHFQMFLDLAPETPEAEKVRSQLRSP